MAAWHTGRRAVRPPRAGHDDHIVTIRRRRLGPLLGKRCRRCTDHGGAHQNSPRQQAVLSAENVHEKFLAPTKASSSTPNSAWTHDTNRALLLRSVNITHKARAAPVARECAAGCKIVTFSGRRVWSCIPAGRARERLFALHAVFLPVIGRGSGCGQVQSSGRRSDSAACD